MQEQDDRSSPDCIAQRSQKWAQNKVQNRANGTWHDSEMEQKLQLGNGSGEGSLEL